MTQRMHALVSTELAPEGQWAKSSYSSQNNGNCLETAVATGSFAHSGRLGVRDSKRRAGPALTFLPTAWQEFVTFVTERPRT